MSTLIDTRAADLLSDLDLDIDADEVEILERAMPQNNWAQIALEFAWAAYRVAQNAQDMEAQEAADDDALWATAGAIC